MKIRPVVAELFDADRQTDGHDALNGRFSEICESTYKNSIFRTSMSSTMKMEVANFSETPLNFY